MPTLIKVNDSNNVMRCKVDFQDVINLINQVVDHQDDFPGFILTEVMWDEKWKEAAININNIAFIVEAD